MCSRMALIQEQQLVSQVQVSVWVQLLLLRLLLCGLDSGFKSTPEPDIQACTLSQPVLAAGIHVRTKQGICHEVKICT